MSLFSFFAKKPKTAATTTAAAAVLIASPFTAHHEGLRLQAYLDPVGIPTICYGETQNVSIGMTKTKQECDALFTVRLGFFAMGVNTLVNVSMTPHTHAALTSFSYNVGLGAFSKSTLLKKLNAGDLQGACDGLLEWNKAKGVVLPGLVKRRQDERKLCLEGGIQNDA